MQLRASCTRCAGPIPHSPPPLPKKRPLWSVSPSQAARSLFSRTFVPSTFSPLDAQPPLHCCQPNHPPPARQHCNTCNSRFLPILGGLVKVETRHQSHFFPMSVCQRAVFATDRVPSDIYDHCLEPALPPPALLSFLRSSIVPVTYIALSSRQGRPSRWTRRNH